MAPPLLTRMLCAVALLLHTTSAEAPCPVPSAPGSRAPADKCLTDIQRRIIDTFSPHIETHFGRVVLFDVAVHVNMGDSLLWLGAKRLLNRFGRTPDLICAMTQIKANVQEFSFPRCPKPAELVDKYKDQPLLVLWHAGGNFGDVYTHNGRMRYIKELDEVTAATGANVTLIQLPNSVYYSSVSEFGKSDKETLTGLKALKFVLFSRSFVSQEVVDLRLSNDTNFGKTSPDIGFMAGPLHTLTDPIVDLILIIRRDPESEISPQTQQNMAKQFFARPENSNITYKLTDWSQSHFAFTYPWVNGHTISADVADVRLMESLLILGQARGVVTNRFHGVVLSMLMHKPVFWFEAKKIKGYNKVGSTITLAMGSSGCCTNDILQSYPAAAEDETDAFAESLEAAAAYFR